MAYSSPPEGVQKAKAIMHACRLNGVNLFDNAEVYGNPGGAAETCMGQAMAELREEFPDQWEREQIIVTTKLFWGGASENEKGLSRKHAVEVLWNTRYFF